MFMALIQDDSSKNGNYCISIKGSKVKGTHEIISKPLKKLSYNGIYMSPRKSEVKKKSRNLEWTSKNDTSADNRHSYNGISIS